MRLFVDTSVWYAAVDRGDAGNERAKRVLSGAPPLVTTDHVLVETWLLVDHRIGRRAAERLWTELRGGVADIEIVGAADLEAAHGIAEVFADQDFSVVDRTSFAVMERLGLREVATFDDDFAVYRFGPGRSRAFSVRR